jgi:hypothetical protein
MKTQLSIICAAIVGIVFATGVSTWAGDAGTSTPSCQVAKPDKHAVKFTGTLAVDAYTNVDQPLGFQDGDVLLRLENGKTVKFFRMRLNLDYAARDNGNVVCGVLNPNEDPSGEVAALVQAILTAFGLPTNYRFVITPKNNAITDDEDITADRRVCGLQTSGASCTATGPGGVFHAGSLLDVIVYAQP